MVAIITLAAVTLSSAQEDLKPADPSPSAGKKSANGRTDILLQLGLSREQRQEIRRLNADRKPLMQAAQSRFREANRLLDESIYADVIDEMAIWQRLRDVQTAQGEVQRIRNTSELSIRKLLTAEQLVRFRDIRQNFERGRVRQDIVQQRQGLDQQSPDVRVVSPGNTRPMRRYLKRKRQR